MSAAGGRYAAIDLGASSARVISGRLVGGRLEVEEVARVANQPMWMTGGLHWDLLGLYRGIVEGIAALSGRAGDLVSVGVDGWGNDYGLIDADGRLMGAPFHYRDLRTVGRVEEADRLVGLRRIYQATGIQVMRFNTLYQLLAERASASYQAAAQLLLLPDLMAYLLTGERRLERTNASTTQLVDARTGRMADWLLERLGLRPDLFAAPSEPGEPVGEILADVADSAALPTRPLVVTVASHDTASAVLAVPASDRAFAYVVSGTWSLVGLELEAPVIDDDSYRHNFSNELGADGSVRFLTNVMGHWMLQECMRDWDGAGRRTSVPQLLAAAEGCQPFRSLVDTGRPEFAQRGNMPGRVRAACARAGEPVPESDSELVRCLLDSMAIAIAEALEEAGRLAGREIGAVHVVGGGASNGLLLSLLAAATGREVLAGPVEASSIGNLLVQLRAAGAVQGRSDGRDLVRRSFPPTPVLPDPGLVAAARRARHRLRTRRSDSSGDEHAACSVHQTTRRNSA